MTDRPMVPDLLEAPATCPRCTGDRLHVRPAPQAGEPPELVQCRECSFRAAHGHLMPRVVVQPHADARFTVLTIGEGADEQQFVFDTALAKMIGSCLESLG